VSRLKAIAAEDEVDQIVAAIRALRRPDDSLVFVSGNFNIIHPGHLRLLNFAAECGDVLVVAVHADGSAGTIVAENLRLEGVRSIGVVDFAFILRTPLEAMLAALRPTIVVKGKEYESRPNPEQAILDTYGGKLLFSSGEMRFSSLDLLKKELYEPDFSTIVKPRDFPERHGFRIADLVPLVRRFAGLRVVVVGDLIVDEYISCDALGMSQEDPTLVVMPIETDRFIGGAGIVAAHAAGVGATVQYFGVIGEDEAGAFATETLRRYGVAHELFVDASRPTTLKRRYRAKNKTLLRVSHLRQHDISAELARKLFDSVTTTLDGADLLVFSDFNYGGLPQSLVDSLIDYCSERGVLMVADSQASSQMADVSRFRGMRLLTPTEYEARLAMRDFQSGLVVLAESLRQKAQAQHILVTLGVEGLLIHAGVEPAAYATDRLPAFNTSPKDISGAGDSLLICASLATAVGADIWQSAYLGSLAAACQVSRVGNTPLSIKELIQELML